jgi:nitrite reductase/ring-hydroxylating ferredoxin subunit/uncharacterized membrane protein
MSIPLRLAARLERWEALDRVSAPLQTAVGRAVRPQGLRDVLSGAKLGHPLHPVVKDVPIGAWSMSVLLDALGGRKASSAADLLLSAGIVAAVPTAAAGLNDWSDTTGEDSRVGLVHAAANLSALSLFTASRVARGAGHRTTGKSLSAAGLALMSVGGFLGGHLVFGRGVNVNRTAFEARPADWTAVLGGDEIGEGEARTVIVGRESVLLYREDGQLSALAETCTHLGGPLGQGRIHAGCVTCPWHGSTFRLGDGSVVRGPASSPQPVYDVRVSNGQVEVRAR